MGDNLTVKILKLHLVEGELHPGSEIGIRIDQTLLQDATGTMAMLEFESLGLSQVRTECSVVYVDHNIIQADHRNADDHRYLQTASMRYGIHFSPPGNGICHQVHMERFGEPGKTLIGADSHTPSAGALGMLAIGAGGLDVALAMAGRPYYMPCPKVAGIKLVGRLPKWVSAKDVILELLRRYGVGGFVGKVIEYYGPGLECLSATDRLTIANMGTELGATTSVFPSDSRTKRFLEAQGRGGAWKELLPDPDPFYDEHDEIDLSSLEPLISCPSSPGNVRPVRKVAGLPVDQVIAGSCVNSSFRDLMIIAKILEGRHVHPRTFFHINPGSRQVLENISAQNGLLSLLRAGARVHEPGCLGCIGMGQAPGTGQVSLRTFPRNFPGRSGTKDDQVYLCSPETAAASALKGGIHDPRELEVEMKYPQIEEPFKYLVDSSSIIYASEALSDTEIVRGPNIRPLPSMGPLPDDLELRVLLKLGNNVSTDTIMPASSHILPLRSNIKALSRYVFASVDKTFSNKCRESGQVAIVGGDNYGQGSSREHAALCPRYLGVRVKLVKSFARIHKANLCNFGIIPLTFKDPLHYGMIKEGQILKLPNIRRLIQEGRKDIPVLVEGMEISTILDISERQRRFLLAGGALNLVREELTEGA